MYMKKSLLPLILFLFNFCFTPSLFAYDYIIEGLVIDTVKKEPIPKAKVWIEGGSETFTDKDGKYTLTVSSLVDRKTIKCSKKDYLDGELFYTPNYFSNTGVSLYMHRGLMKVQGQVLDNYTNYPISTPVKIKEGRDILAVTDSLGNFEFEYKADARKGKKLVLDIDAGKKYKKEKPITIKWKRNQYDYHLGVILLKTPKQQQVCINFFDKLGLAFAPPKVVRYFDKALSAYVAHNTNVSPKKLKGINSLKNPSNPKKSLKATFNITKALYFDAQCECRGSRGANKDCKRAINHWEKALRSYKQLTDCTKDYFVLQKKGSKYGITIDAQWVEAKFDGAIQKQHDCVPPKPILGCTDITAVNHEPHATQDDGSCHRKGCTDPLAINYNPKAKVDDGSCLIKGCTKICDSNYNPKANVLDENLCENDNVCGCMDIKAVNYDKTAKRDDCGIQCDCQYKGCKDPNAKNYDPTADFHDQSMCTYEEVIGKMRQSLEISVSNYHQSYQNLQVDINQGLMMANMQKNIDEFHYERTGDYGENLVLAVDLKNKKPKRRNYFNQEFGLGVYNTPEVESIFNTFMTTLAKYDDCSDNPECQMRVRILGETDNVPVSSRLRYVGFSQNYKPTISGSEMYYRISESESTMSPFELPSLRYPRAKPIGKDFFVGKQIHSNLRLGFLRAYNIKYLLLNKSPFSHKIREKDIDILVKTNTRHSGSKYRRVAMVLEFSNYFKKQTEAILEQQKTLQSTPKPWLD